MERGREDVEKRRRTERGKERRRGRGKEEGREREGGLIDCKRLQKVRIGDKEVYKVVKWFGNTSLKKVSCKP